MNTSLKMSFEVACSAEHAFRTWTSEIGTWWPSDHTVTGEPDLEDRHPGPSRRAHL